ncbi:Cof-type HAD-IIB family hydrolase [Streptococcus sciuri]|uniref:Cof-type HAD-IIB family hydrolase n=1 Tax=Streptococcus sciuri TaxID=2973939 RepID=A0ABT2F747_9STRE|nr:Cof-type HAD-IIB family hydrolase [Streptococcus sciuri]MCS4488210.1 Cof-type HAD-IIB family hydrolase [Streptococcus sciuri]
MAIKAVFFDIDGTLLNDRKNVQKSTHLAISILKEQGIIVGVATGRGPSFVQPYLENLGLDIAITYNGQYIYTRDKIIFINPISRSLVYRVIRYASEKRCDISLGTASGLVGSGIIGLGTSRFGQWVSSLIPRRMIKTVGRSFKHLLRRFKPQNTKALFTLLREPIFQIVMVASGESTKKIKGEFPHLQVTRSSPYSVDFISQGQSKIKGIVKAGSYFGFDLSEVMAFGDSENDLEMLSGVGLGIAMGNADDKIKALADYTTASNNSDGIAKALSHYGLIQLGNETRFDSKDVNFNKVKDFHELVDGDTNETPRIYASKEAGYRADFKVEEIVEFLYAASQGDKKTFTQSVLDLHVAVDKAAKKVQAKAHPETPLVGEVDALVDLLYLTYGSFVLMGVDPKPLFDTVHEANMGKIFPDGKAHFDPVTHKVLKPDDWEERFAPEPKIKRELDRQLQKALNRSQNRSSK